MEKTLSGFHYWLNSPDLRGKQQKKQAKGKYRNRGQTLKPQEINQEHSEKTHEGNRQRNVRDTDERQRLKENDGLNTQQLIHKQDTGVH